jgi:SPP1 gp7 family putative phage head morphogenesis protein
VFLGTIEKDRQSLARKISLKLVRPLVQMNFGDIKCEFKFVEFTEGDISQYADLWIRAVSGKIFKPNPEEINHLRSITGFPEGDVNLPEPLQLDEEGNPIPPKPGMPRNPGEKPGMPGETGQEDADEGQEKAEEDEEGKEGVAGKKPPLPPKEMSLKMFRQATVYEKKVDFAQIKSVLDGAEDSMMPGLRQAAKRIYSDYLAQIRDKGLIRNFQPEKINALEPRFLREMNVLFKNHFRDLFRESLSEAQKELLTAPPKKFSEPLLPEEFEEILNAESFKVVGDYSTHITKKAKNVLVNGIKEGRSEADILAAIRELAADETETWLSAVVRTKITEVYNKARRSYWETDEIAKQIVTAYQFSAIIDSRTSEICAELDGKIFDLEDEIARVTPPMHINCRSILVPITRYEDYKAEKVPSADKIQDMGGNLKNFEIKHD